MARMRILTKNEREIFDQPPLFDHRARKQFFDLPKGLMDIAATLRTPGGKIGFLLMCGYFKATKRFYQPQDFHARDIEAVAKVIGLQDTDFSHDTYAKQTRARHQQLILDSYGFVPFDEKTKKTLAVEISAMAQMHLKPRLIFDRCVDFLVQHRIQVPTSRNLTDSIRTGLHERKAELVGLMDDHLCNESRRLLDDLFAAPEDQNRYRLTLLKKLSQSTRPTRIKEAVSDFEVLSELYHQLGGILSKLELGVAGIRYFAGNVFRSEIFQMQRRDQNDRYIHATAFVAHQFYRCQDNMIDLWLSVMATFKSAAAREYQENLVQDRKDQQRQIEIIVDGLEVSVFGVLRGIDNVMAAANLSDAEKVSATKVFLFQAVTTAIKSGDLNVEKSYKYRPMDAYLIDKERWKREKAPLLGRAGLSEFTGPEPVLSKLNAALSHQYQTTNAHTGDNPHLKLRKDGAFHIATPALDANEADPLGDLFPQRHDVPLAQVLETVNNHCNMLAAFEHWQQTHVRQATSHPALLAGIMGLGCGIGVRKMARISSQVTESEFDHTVNWRFSLENIRTANDAVVKAMDKMDMPNLHRQTQDQLHTASDGQKFEVRGDSLHASRSFKYFGQGQGVSAYTFVDERNFLWHSLMISAADRESAYVIDGLMHNDVIKSDIHSTDTLGILPLKSAA